MPHIGLLGMPYIGKHKIFYNRGGIQRMPPLSLFIVTREGLEMFLIL